jgi:hypothetical protein
MFDCTRDRLVGWLALSAAALLAGGCGSGGGGGDGGASNALVIQSTALPAVLSGQVVDHAIPFSGGSGGPYILEVLEGELPDGVNLDDGTVSIVGRLLEDGAFDFRLRLVDTGSEPFASTTAEFHWEVGIGPVTFATEPELPVVVYNQFVLVDLVVAGGTGPYSCEVVDDPANPNDGPLPTGLSIPPDSCSIVGSPQQANPGNAPFFVTIQARDHADVPGFPNPGTATRTFELSVLVPPVLVVTTSMPDGTCGEPYNEKVEISDGVGPFRHELVTDVGQLVRLKGEPGTPDGVAKGSADSAYAEETDVGPAYPKRFPEGVTLGDSTGEVKGVPRRRGTFTDWTYHVQSTALPDDPTQNQWRNFTFSMAEATPPVLDPSVLAPGSTGFAPPANQIPELEVTKPYLVQFGCLGGVAMDGTYDAPHVSEAVADPTEEAGLYSFTVPPADVPPGMTMSPLGLFSGTPTARSGFKAIHLAAVDEQLPTSAALALPHAVTGEVQYSIGPDVVVITESLSSCSGANLDDPSYGYASQTVSIFEPFSGTPTVRSLQSGDMAAGHTHPISGGSLSDSLSDIDFLSVSVNPTWWAYDVFNLNARSARAAQHADAERRYVGDALHSDWWARTFGGGGYPRPVAGSDHSSNLAVELPEATGASPSHDPASGTYRDGGLLYAYDNDDEFGFFVVRKDGKLQIPVAFRKPSAGGTYTGFGDGWITADRTRPSGVRRPQITVSPDGRFAAVKVKTDVGTFLEAADDSRIALFSLAGEKPFAGGTSTFALIQTGSGGTSTTGGVYLYADSLTLTNRFLYYIVGDLNGVTNGNAVIYSRHYVYRYEIAGGATGGSLLNSGFNSSWTNVAGATPNPLAMPWHKWQTPGAGSITAGSTYYLPSIPASSGDNGPNPHFFHFNYANFSENSMAPHPFRVSANGNAVAILAAPNGVAGVAGTTFARYSIFVDYDSGSGAPVFREVTATPRRFGAPTRNGGFGIGPDVATTSYTSQPSTDRLYGWYDGPATQVEISDDGKAVAAVFNTSTASWSTTTGRSNEPTAREDLTVLRGTSASAADPWSSISASVPTSSKFPSFNWRFGCLAFTRDSLGLVFWAGFSNAGGSTFSATGTNSAYDPVWAGIQAGTLYSYDVASGALKSVLASSDGGNQNGVATYSGTVSITDTPWTGNQGPIGPIGAFYSNDGRFFYVRSAGPLSSSEATANRLVGVNVSAASGSTINGKAAMAGFAPAWPQRRGFGPVGYNYYGCNFRFHRGVGGAQTGGFGQQASAARSGLVFFAGYNNYAGPSTYPDGNYGPTSTYYYYNPHAHPSYYPDYCGLSGEVYGFDANVGGDVFTVTTLSSAVSNVVRPITYLQPDETGSRLAFVCAPATPSPYDHRPASEQVGLATGIVTTATGSLAGGLAVTMLEGTSGRAGVSFAHDYIAPRLYYAFGTGGNENTQVLTEKTLNAAGTSVASTRTMPGLLGGSGGQARFAVLHSGR